MDFRIRYQYTRADLREVQAAFRRVNIKQPAKQQSTHPWTFIGWVVLVCFFVGIFALFREHSPVPAASAPAGAKPEPFISFMLNVIPWLIIGLIVYVVFFFQMRRNTPDDPRLAIWHEVHITEELITEKIPNCVVTMEWHYFIFLHETKNHFMLYFSKFGAFAIPKRAFAAPADVDLFRSFAQANIGSQPIGFPVLPEK